jgi:hypothetical protein
MLLIKRAWGAGNGARAMDGQAIVLFEIAGPCTRLAERGVDALGSFLGDVFIERARAMPGGQDALDSFDAERAVTDGVSEGGVEALGFVALAEEQDAAGDVTPRNAVVRR